MANKQTQHSMYLFWFLKSFAKSAENKPLPKSKITIQHDNKPSPNQKTNTSQNQKTNPFPPQTKILNLPKPKTKLSPNLKS